MKTILNHMSQTKQSAIYKRFEKLDQGCLLNLKHYINTIGTYIFCN